MARLSLTVNLHEETVGLLDEIDIDDVARTLALVKDPHYQYRLVYILHRLAEAKALVGAE